MSRFVSKKAKTFKKNEKGVTMLEYGLIAALIAVVSITVLSNIGTQLSTAFQTIETHITTANK